MLIALGKEHELKLHLNGALNNGLTKDEIKEVLLQTAIYCGVPAAVVAFRCAREVFKDRKRENVAFIGLGSMGQPMAANLAKEGFAVRSFDLNGTGSSPSVRDAAAGAES